MANENQNQINVPAWAQALGYIGIPGFIALAMLGFVPGVRSPIDRIEGSISSASASTDNQLAQNRATQQEMLRVLREICNRLSSGNTERRSCGS